MKNQNDLIFSIVAGVIGIGCALVFYFTKREPIAPAPPTTVPTAMVALPDPAPGMVNGLSGGSNNAGGGFGGGFPGGAGGPMSPPGRPGVPGGGGRGPEAPGTMSGSGSVDRS